jgi:hypothetical protein
MARRDWPRKRLAGPFGLTPPRPLSICHLTSEKDFMRYRNPSLSRPAAERCPTLTRWRHGPLRPPGPPGPAPARLGETLRARWPPGYLRGAAAALWSVM